jgi:predicted dithiol-disulfide oxidoreductase (DUF899 family)
MAEPDQALVQTPRFPGETVEYRRARDELLAEEAELRLKEEEVAEKRRSLPLGGAAPAYSLQEWDRDSASARSVGLGDLFEPGRGTLLVYSHMFNPGPTGTPLETPCPLCTSMVDGLDGLLPHITQRLNVAIASKAPIERLVAHAQARGWRNARLLSTAGTSYNSDYGAELSDSEQLPMATVFVQHEGAVRHFWSAELLTAPTEPGQSPRHIDFMWPLWSVLDRTPEGRGSDWWPSLAYRS